MALFIYNILIQRLLTLIVGTFGPCLVFIFIGVNDRWKRRIASGFGDHVRDFRD